MNIVKPNSFIRILFTALGLALLQSCARVQVQPVTLPFDNQKIAQIVSSLKEQEWRVHAFFSSGRLIVEQHNSEPEANILIIGTKDPLKIKIEITHPWGRPLFHILIHETRLHIVSFPEKRYYVGRLESLDTPVFFPGSLDPDQLWALLRGFPVIRKFDHAVSMKGNQITLIKEGAETAQVIDLYPESILPRLISFPDKGIKLSFSDFENANGILYARKIRLNKPATETTLALNQKQMVFNKTIPESIFELEIPRNFKVIPLRGARE